MPHTRNEELKALEKRIGYRFGEPALLNTALTHTSFVKGDGKGQTHNERLEYLGDAVLELCVTEQLYRRYPKWSEGNMTRARASIVREASLYGAAKSFGLQEYLLLGHGEEVTGGRDKPSILSDALEALIGAIYLDGGFDCAKKFVLSWADDMLNRVEKGDAAKDNKSILQEYVQKKHLGGLQYKLISATGPDHKKEFKIHAFINSVFLGEGVGNSKQEAGQMAAAAAIAALKEQEKSGRGS